MPSTSAYPPIADTFTAKIDEDQPVQETVTIPATVPFQHQLQQVPKGSQRNPNGTISLSTLYIRDFREIEGTPQQAGQYNVDYNTGMVTFNPLDKSKVVLIVYKTAGNNIMASDFNKLQDAILALENFAIHPYLTDSNDVKWYLYTDTSGTITTSVTP